MRIHLPNTGLWEWLFLTGKAQNLVYHVFDLKSGRMVWLGLEAGRICSPIFGPERSCQQTGREGSWLHLSLFLLPHGLIYADKLTYRPALLQTPSQHCKLLSRIHANFWKFPPVCTSSLRFTVTSPRTSFQFQVCTEVVGQTQAACAIPAVLDENQHAANRISVHTARCMQILPYHCSIQGKFCSESWFLSAFFGQCWAASYQGGHSHETPALTGGRETWPVSMYCRHAGFAEVANIPLEITLRCPWLQSVWPPSICRPSFTSLPCVLLETWNPPWCFQATLGHGGLYNNLLMSLPTPDVWGG